MEQDIKGYYKRKEVVNKYINYRFSSPIGRIEHRNQVEVVQDTIKANKAQRVLEIAPGPARITRYIDVKEGIALDYSQEMIDTAKKEMQKSKYKKKWKFIQRDFFKAKFNNKFDIIYTFRFIFHFSSKERKKIYKKAYSILNKSGLLIFEIRNKRKAKLVKKIVNIIHLFNNNYPIHQEFHTPKEIEKELKQNKFELMKLEPNISHFFTETCISKLSKLFGFERKAEKIIKRLEKIRGINPLFYTVVCKKT